MRRTALYIVAILYSCALGAWNWWPLPMAQPDTCRDTLQYAVTFAATAGSGTYNTFWMQSNEQGGVAMTPYSGALRAAVVKPATRPNRWFDYDGAVEIQAFAHSALPLHRSLMPRGSFPVYQGRHGGFMVRRMYAHVRLYIVDIAAGVMPVTDGMDTPLGSGSLLFSQNAPSMPAIRIGFDRWTPVPGLYGYMELKGGLLHAWLTDDIHIRHAKLHYKWAGVQFGGKLPVNVSYEFHHAAQWGGYRNGEDLGNGWNAFRRVFLAQEGGQSYNEQKNALGNHVASQQLALTAKGKGWHVKLYWQNFLEDNFAILGKGHNLPDGRWGVCAQQTEWPFLHTLTMEYINTTDQSGPMHDQDGIIYAGRDSYYTNSIYTQGWNYYLRSIGTPLITSPLYNTDEETQTLNSRIQAWHIGVGGDIYGFRYRVMGTYVRNYGRYEYDDWYRLKSTNTALMLEVNKQVKQAWDLEFGVRLAADFGNQWGNQVSAMITVSKKGLITKW